MTDVFDDDPAAVAAWLEELDAEIVAAADDDAEPTATVEARAPFRVTDVATAERAMRLLARVTAELAEIDRLHAEWITRYDEWRAQQRRQPERVAEWLTGMLSRYAIEQRRETDGRVKTIALPSGKVSTSRATAPKAVVPDRDRFLNWIDEHIDPDIGRMLVKRSPALTAIREAFPLVHVDHEAPDVNAGEGRWVAVDPATGEEIPSDVLAVELPSTSASVKPTVIDRGGL